MIRKVVYVSTMRLSDKASRDWYVDYLIEKGMPVEYWDVASLLFGDDGIRSKQTAFLRTPTTYAELAAMLDVPENKSTRYVMVVSYGGPTARLYKLFSKYGCRMVFISWGELPIGQSHQWRRRLSNVVASATSAAGTVKAALYRKLGLVRRFEVVFAAGEAVLANAQFANRVVPINLIDYDHYVRTKSAPERLVVEPYAIFLDIYLPHQSDLRIVGLGAIDSTEYYQSLNRFFGLIETTFGVKVAIAAHPKAVYDAQTFEGRPFYVGRTPQLVRDAEFVISHHSTSLSYAVLNRKPIVFIYTNDMKKLYELTIVTYLHDLSAYLGASICNIDEITRGDQVEMKPVDEKRYDEYKYDFLTSRASEHARTEEIFWRELREEIPA